MQIVKMDEARYLAELNASHGRRSGGIITKTLKAMQIGQKWIVPDYIRMASVRSICSQLHRKDWSRFYIVRNNKQQRHVICAASILPT